MLPRPPVVPIDVPASPATGNSWTYTAHTAQVLGIDIIFANDSSIMVISYTHAPASSSETLSLTNARLFRRRKGGRVLTLKLFHYEDNLGTRTITTTPSVRVEYRWRDNLTFETELGLEWSKVDATTGTTKSFHDSFFIGYRWDI